MKWLKTSAVWLILIALVAAAVFLQTPNRVEPFTTFVMHVQHGRMIHEVRINGNEIGVTLANRKRYTSLGAIDSDLMQQLAAQGVRVRYGAATSPVSSYLFMGLVAIVCLLALVYFLRKTAGNASTSILTLGKSRARVLAEEATVKFTDVAGADEAKAQLGDVIDFLKDPERWTDAGARIPRGVLLEGPPGCGKTLLARAVAGETSARFYFVSASEFVEMFIGVGAARVRDMFETAAKNAPAVIFIDELDAVGRRRGSGIGSGHDEREQTLNQLLVCLDGFEALQRIVVIAATNRPDILDHALLRPGRFDRRIRIPSLSEAARLEALQIHTRNKLLREDVSLEDLARQTDGYNGAELEQLANEAVLLAVRAARDGTEPVIISRECFDRALAPADSKPRLFNKLDSVLVESTSQLAEPTGKALVRMTLDEQTVVEGEVLWVDASFIKVRELGTGFDKIIAKHQIQVLEALPGTDAESAENVMIDAWAGRQPDLA